jgi:hypothetical protein
MRWTYFLLTAVIFFLVNVDAAPVVLKTSKLRKSSAIIRKLAIAKKKVSVPFYKATRWDHAGRFMP